MVSAFLLPPLPLGLCHRGGEDPLSGAHTISPGCLPAHPLANFVRPRGRYPSCCRYAANTSAGRASAQNQSAALRILPTQSRPTRTEQSPSAWTQSRAAATATPAAISIPLCTSKPKSRPHSRGLARYAYAVLELLWRARSVVYRIVFLSCIHICRQKISCWQEKCSCSKSSTPSHSRF